MTASDHVGFDELDELIHRLRLGTGAPELHGSLCGFLAGGGQVGTQSLLRVLQLDGEVADPPASDLAVLDQLVKQSLDELDDPALGFEPLLPADDRPLAERADALVEWCRGFLGGFGLGGSSAHAKLSDEAQEILRDLGVIAASSLELGDQDQDEDALIEVHEFVRVGALLLHTECAAHAHPGGSKAVH